ncbi:Succinate--CoA ligase [GDP-forming] subunit beta, mitochondrial [Bulinus truncatus]|nr:Succinate--CoA ligase [GDP-forming] subunit beta, mitochondrial [Bulinus truncatus]
MIKFGYAGYQPKNYVSQPKLKKKFGWHWLAGLAPGDTNPSDATGWHHHCTFWHGNGAVFTEKGNGAVFTEKGNGAVFTEKGNGAVFSEKGNGAVFTEKGNGAVFTEKGNGVVFTEKGNGVVFTEKGNGAVFSEKGNGVVFTEKGNGAQSAGTDLKKLDEHNVKILKCFWTYILWAKFLNGWQHCNMATILRKVIHRQCKYIPLVSQTRKLNLHEFQSKKLMSENGISVQKFEVAGSKEDATKIASKLKVKEYVIKAQILAGGRGKGVFDSGFKGGVHLTKDPQKVESLVDSMLGHKLSTKQTSKDGVMVRKVMVAEALDIARETYFAILMDRSFGGPVLVGSPKGGIDIEEVAKKEPEAIFTEPIDIISGLQLNQALKMAENLGFTGQKQKKAAEQMVRLYKLFLKVDATQVEINPFGETVDGRVVCFDAKINFDDNAQFRQKEIFSMDDMSESDPREVEASKYNLNYIGMDGNIACLVNGAGLAMATMDIIKLHGGSPANFLDVGGTVTENQVFHAFKLLSADKQVKAILVNIFGGIVNCATIAKGISSAYKSIQLSLPLIVRLEGTNVDEARKILESSNMPIITATDLDDAAKKAVSSLNCSISFFSTLIQFGNLLLHSFILFNGNFIFTSFKQNGIQCQMLWAKKRLIAWFSVKIFQLLFVKLLHINAVNISSYECTIVISFHDNLFK